MLPIEEIDDSFHWEFKSQTNIQELQSRNMKSMFVAIFSLSQEVFLRVCLENRKGSSSTPQEDVLDKKFKSCKSNK